MKKILATCAILFCLAVNAKPGGFSSGARASSPSRGSFSSAPAPRPSAPVAAPRPSAPVAAPRPSAPVTAPRTTTTTTTTVNRTYTSRYVSGGGYYCGWGMGYHYNNGLMTGLILGNMMHPYGTVMYAGPGMYANNALLYPNGQVVNQQGYVVGTYINGVFNPIQNGPMVAQNVPADAGSQPVAQAQPVVINSGPTTVEIVIMTVMAIFALVFVVFIILT